MKKIKEEINPYTLKFVNQELETSYQTSCKTYKGLPLMGKIAVVIIIIFIIIRRIQKHIETQTEDNEYNFKEYRITIIMLAGLVFETIFCLVNKLIFLQGTVISVTAFWAMIDASIIYSPDIPNFSPLYFSICYPKRGLPCICTIFIILPFFVHNWIISGVVLAIDSIFFVVYYNISYDMNESILLKQL